jgi:hypothetical protein
MVEASATKAARASKPKATKTSRTPRPKRVNSKPRIRASRSAARPQAGSEAEASKATGSTPRSDRNHTRGDRQDEGLMGLIALALAMILGAVGFLVHFFWIASIVVMAVSLGSMIARRQLSATRDGGVVSEVVATVVDEVREIASSTAGSSAEVAETT